MLVFTDGATFPKETFSLGLVRLEGKNDEKKVTFDDSYICYVSKIDVFQSSFVSVFTKGTTFSEEIFL